MIQWMHVSRFVLLFHVYYLLHMHVVPVIKLNLGYYYETVPITRCIEQNFHKQLNFINRYKYKYKYKYKAE